MDSTCLLVVEDEWVNREILLELLGDAGYQMTSAADGQGGWDALVAEPERFSAILLDRVLPGMDGLEVLRRVKRHPTLAHIPVIMQTSMAEPEEILEGLRAGAHYYLTKPFAPETLLAIVHTAVEDHLKYRELQREARQAARTLQYLNRAEFAFRSPSEARDIAALLANACPDGIRVVLGLSELMLNAVEHGNLGITYEEKSTLISTDRLYEEVAVRLANPEYASKQAIVEVERTHAEIRFLIRDQGKGFNWRQYLEIRPERAFDTHGRGIAMARMTSFDQVEYRGRGNEVLAVVKLQRAGPPDPWVAEH